MHRGIPFLMLTPRLVAYLLFLGLLAGSAQAVQPAEFSSWPAGASPTEVGERVAKNFLARQFQWQTNPKRTLVIYPEVCAWYGSLTYAELAGNQPLTAQLVAKYEVLLAGQGTTKISSRDHVDDRVFGAAPLEIYRQTRNEKFLTAGRALADAQWNEPST